MKIKLALLSLFVLGSATLAADDVLIIESYHAEYQWDADYTLGIEGVLGSKYSVITFELDTRRISKDKFEEKAEEAWQKYLEVKPKLVFLGDDRAMKYLAPKFVETDTPVVFLGVNKTPGDYYDTATTKNITGVLERPLVEQSLALIAQIIEPTPQKALVLFVKGTSSQTALADIFTGKSVLKVSGMEAELKLIGDWSEWQNTVKNAKVDGYDVAFIGFHHKVTDDGKPVPSGKVLEWSSKNFPIPVFGYWSSFAGVDKTAGGLVLCGKEQGKDAAEIALKILEGALPSTIPPMIGENGQLLFSRKQLDRYKLTLPANINSKAVIID